MAFTEPNAEIAPPEGEAPPEGAVETTPEAPPAETTPEPAPDYSWVDEYGGKDAIADAVEIANALRDDEGVRALVEEGLKHLGLDPTKVFQPEAPAEEEDPDRLMTAAEVKAELAALQQQQARQAQQVQMQVAAAAVDEARQALGIESEEEWDLVRSFAQRHTTPTELDPVALVEAVKRGKADADAAIQAAAKKYVEDRANANNGVPQPVKGGGVSGGSEPPAPPKNMDEARAAARAYLRQNQ